MVSPAIRLFTHILLALSLASASTYSNAQHSDNISREQKIKAAYLYHLTKFIDWPGQHSNKLSKSINVCIIGQQPFANFLQQLESKKAKGRPIKVISTELSSTSNPQCHIVFYQSSKQAKGEQLQKFARQGALTVGEKDSFTSQGGMVGMVVVDNHIRLQINYQLTKQAGILVSANLLEVATIVE